MRRMGSFAGILAAVLLALSSLAIPQDRDRDRDDQRHDAQPHMQQALDSLNQAKQHLQAAEHDKGGHRARALQLVDQAISQVRQGMQYDRTHESKAEEKRERH